MKKGDLVQILVEWPSNHALWPLSYETESDIPDQLVTINVPKNEIMVAMDEVPACYGTKGGRHSEKGRLFLTSSGHVVSIINNWVDNYCKVIS